jgi:tetratricopeptide (TPR) repeat protein/tRNA A-37 threonylcarbamoyl transferase component Bud32
MTGPTDGDPHCDAPAGISGPDQSLLALLQAHQRRGWRRGGRPPVEAYIEQHPELQADAESVLDLIYTEIMLREEAGESPQLADYLSRFPHLETRLRRQFEVERALGSAPSNRADTKITWPGLGAPTDDAPRSIAIPGYEVLGELGRGGMGVVYKARHARLNRIVALKMILAGEHAGPEVSVRFLAEAEAVARLHHPNIIQIFAFSAHQGHPYFEMEYADGGSLADRLGGTPWSARDAARLVETLARAIHEVHRVGIVHRDLKPANVLLAADGTPKIADFGLAEALDVEARLTRTLRIVGSPSYMAPEQAGAGSDPIGPAADVYALGAILYELVTGRPPFLEATVLETLERVKSAEPISPRRLRPDVPRDLATVCLTCLQKEPARRYAGADLLAEDLRRFGAGEPVRARPVGLAGRAWRWCRREPALAALVVALLGGLIGSATQWWRAERHLDEAGRRGALLREALGREIEARRAAVDAYAHEQEDRRRAEARFRLGMEAVDGYASLADEDALRKDPRLGSLRKRMLDTAQRFSTALQESLESDPTPQARDLLSGTYARVGNLHAAAGARGEALIAFRRALAIREALVAADPSDHHQRAGLARIHRWIGTALRASGRLDEATRSLERAVAIDEAVVRDHPSVGQYQEDLGWCLQELGVALAARGRPAEAVGTQQRALAVREARARVDPLGPRPRADLAWSHHGLAMALDAARRPAEALRHVGRAVEIYEGLVRDHPEDALSRFRLGTTLGTQGLIQRRAGDPGSRSSIERSLAIHEALDREDPTNLANRIALVDRTLHLAAEQPSTGRPAEALARLRDVERVIGQAPDVNPTTLYNLACAYALCSTAARGRDRGPAPAEAGGVSWCADRAMAVLKRAVAAGYSDAPLMRRDVDLDPLRPRRDFQELLRDLSFPHNPFER